jgi:hypothetical protein
VWTAAFARSLKLVQRHAHCTESCTERRDTNTNMPEPPFIGVSVLQLTTPILLEPFAEPIPSLTPVQRESLLDSLSERRVFESNAVAAYAALSQRLPDARNVMADLDAVDLQQIRAEELVHIAFLNYCLDVLNSCCTRTPSVCRTETELAGFVRLIAAADGSFSDALHAAMSLELLDHAGWETLATLAQTVQWFELTERCHCVLQQESRHLAQLSAWYERLLIR